MQKNQNPITLDGSSKREQNRINRANSMAQVDSNDMMSLKAMFMFLNEITNPNSQSFKEFRNDRAMKELISKTNKEFSISPEAASNFFKSEDFMNANKRLIRPFNSNEIEAMSQEVLKKVVDTDLTKFLGVKGYFANKVKDLAIYVVKENLKKHLKIGDDEAPKQTSKETTNENSKDTSSDNVVTDTLNSVVGDVGKNKIHRNLNRNR